MTYILKTFTKSEYEITDEQELKLRTMGLTGKIDVNGSMINASNIAEIVKVNTKGDYRELEAPERVVFSKAQLINALLQMIKGFKNHFGDRKLPPRSQTILAHMEYHLEKARQAKDNKTFTNPLKPFYNNF
jgi:hypothetical protein